MVQYGNRKLSNAIRLVEKWTIANEMTINKLKSGIIYHQKKGGHVDEEENPKFQGYPIKNSYKYLGITLDVNLNFKRHLKTV